MGIYIVSDMNSICIWMIMLKIVEGYLRIFFRFIKGVCEGRNFKVFDKYWFELFFIDWFVYWLNENKKWWKIV